MDELDVYHQWLGIPPHQQPPSLYRLLGLVDFESDADVIRSAAERQAMHVRRLARGEFVDAGQELLNDIAAAKLHLMDLDKRAAYDSVLRSTMPSEEVEGEGPAPDEIVAQQQADDENPGNLTVPEIRATITDSAPATATDQDRWRINEVEATVLDAEQFSVPRGASFLLGYHPDCDVRIDHATVSGMHCRLARGHTTWTVSDLKSTNGTFVNGRKVIKTSLGRNDLLVIGGDHRVIVPRDCFGPESTLATVVFVGRCPGNEVVIDSRRVSRFHARIIIDNELITVEDLKSARGTRLIRQGEEPIRIARCNVRASDVLQLGDINISVGRLVESLNESY